MTEDSPLIKINIGDHLKAVTFSANGEYLVSGHNKGVRVWRAEDGEQIATMKARAVSCLAVSKDRRWIAAGTHRGFVILWDARTYGIVSSHREDIQDVHGVDFSPDSTRLLTAKSNRTATVWDVATRMPVLGPLRHEHPVVAAKYSPQGDRIATATGWSVRVYDSNDGRLLVDVNVNVTRWLNNGLVWSNDQLFVVSDRTFKQVDAYTGSVVSEWPSPGCWCIALPQHGELIVCSVKRAVTLWDTSTRSQLGLIEHSQYVRSLAYSSDDRYLAIGGEEGKITIRSLSRVTEPEIHIDNVTLDLWNHDQFEDVEAMLTQGIVDSQNPKHHALASRALVRARLRCWDAAVVDAEKSIKIRPSVIGYTAKSIALVGKGKRHEAYRTCDIALEHFRSTRFSFLLLVKAIIVFMAGEHEDAISRLDDLITTVPFNSIFYVVQAYMHLLIGNSRMESSDYDSGIQSFERAGTQLQRHGSQPLLVISLISGWRFDDLGVTIRQRLCEALYEAGRTEDAGRSLLEIVSAFEEEVCTSKPITKWVSDFTNRCLSSSESKGDVASRAARHANVPTALSPLVPSPLLKEWAKATLACGSWKDALLAAINFTVSRPIIYRAVCERLETIDRILDASECFHQLWSELAGEADTRNDVQLNWVLDFKHRCYGKLVNIGDVSADAQRHDVAIIHYSAALCLEPDDQRTVFIKRSEVHVAMGLWQDALDDMNQVVASDPSSPWGYEWVLTEWAKVSLMNNSWKDALLAAVDFTTPRFMIYRAICERLETMDRMLDAVECFLQMVDELTGKTDQCKEHAQWFQDFKQRCTEKLARFGDAAADAQRYDDAITQYSAMFLLDPAVPQDIFIKRTKARMAKGLWEDALNDVKEAIALDPSSPWGYEIKHAVLRAAGHHLDAVNTFETMLSKMAQSPDPNIRERRGQYISPSDTRAVIRSIVQRTIRHSPRVLINTSTGRLHSKAEQVSAFESLPVFNELVSSVTTRIDRGHIKREVRQYFRYVMLSHKWEENEPLFQQVIHIAVYDLEKSPTHDKLQMFCMIARDAGFNWAWSDTCCINKQDHFVHQEALVAMFKWYRGSAMMIVFLRGVRSPADFGDLVNSIWNTRAWTFQEYVAAKVIRFYTEDWTPYLDLGISNHKQSTQVISEMEQATGVSAQQLMALRPGLHSIREKLRLASTRETTLTEDAAYSLLGIFSVTGIPAIYGEGESALGRLLAHVLAGSGDASILAWSGQCSTYNSCLPARITVYSRPATSYLPLPIKDLEMEKIATALRASPLDVELALQLYDRLSELPTPWFAASRMRLPCIAFELPALTPYRTRVDRGYRVDTIAFGLVEIKTRQDLSRVNSLYLIHPWLDTLLGREDTDTQSGEFVDDTAEPSSPGTDDEDISDGEVGDDSSSFTEPDDVLPPPVPVHMAPTNREAEALPLISRLGQPFGALLSTLALTGRRRDGYHRVVADRRTTPMERETGALQLVARLRQPFGALLFTLASTGRRKVEYKRVAADSVIAVQIRENVPLDALLANVGTLDVL